MDFQVIRNRSVTMPNDDTNLSALPEDSQLIDFQTCLHSIPLSEAKSIEAQEYITYFCGLDCFDQWIKQKVNPSSET